MTSRDYEAYSISGDWTEIAPGVRVRLQDAPNEEDMEYYEPCRIVILQVKRLLTGNHLRQDGATYPLHD